MIPVISLRREPRSIVLILPYLSALVVRKREMPMSPATMPDCIQLAYICEMPFWKRFWKKMTASIP